jgi:hypothetical protein
MREIPDGESRLRHQALSSGTTTAAWPVHSPGGGVSNLRLSASAGPLDLADLAQRQVRQSGVGRRELVDGGASGVGGALQEVGDDR